MKRIFNICNGNKGKIYSPLYVHIFPGCCLHPTARSESKLFLFKTSNALLIVK